MADFDVECPVVLLSSGDGGADVRAMRIVDPATEAEKRGFVLLSGREALHGLSRDRIIASTDPGVAAIGIEVGVGRFDGLLDAGVVRVALPRDGRVFCTWQLTLTQEVLIRRVGELSPATIGQLDNALQLAGIE
jgi:mRNA interferase MazF